MTVEQRFLCYNEKTAKEGTSKIEIEGDESDMFFVAAAMIVVLVLCVVFCVFLYQAMQGAAQWKKTTDAPVLTVDAVLVGKRKESVKDKRERSFFTHGPSEIFYATFEVESGDRIELEIPDREYSLILENDTGRLTLQGNKYVGFQRESISFGGQ